MLVEIGRAGDESEILGSAGEPGFLDAVFWSLRTHEAEAGARRQLADTEIEAIFDEVAAVVDEDLGRFDPLIRGWPRLLFATLGLREATPDDARLFELPLPTTEVGRERTSAEDRPFGLAGEL